MSSDAPSFPLKKSGYFQIGTKSPKRRPGVRRPPAEKRKVNFKKGINARENRKRRSSLGQDARKRKKTSMVESFRAVASLRGVAESAPLEGAASSGRRYTGSSKEKLVALYKEHNQSKLAVVDATLKKYAGQERVLFSRLAKRYGVDVAVFEFPTFGGNYVGGTFGSLTSPKSKSRGFGTELPSSTSKGRKSITSLNTYCNKLRLSSDSESIMECD